MSFFFSSPLCFFFALLFCLHNESVSYLELIVCQTDGEFDFQWHFQSQTKDLVVYRRSWFKWQSKQLAFLPIILLDISNRVFIWMLWMREKHFHSNRFEYLLIAHDLPTYCITSSGWRCENEVQWRQTVFRQADKLILSTVSVDLLWVCKRWCV